MPGVRARAAALLVVAVVALCGCVLLSLFVGSRGIGPRAVVEAFTAYDGSTAHLVVREIRLPRTLLGVVVGAGLAVAGALMQGLTRNPLASPSVLGVSSGAAFAVVLAIYLLGIDSPLGYVWFAVLGALTCAVGVHVIAGRAQAGPVRLALSGAVLSTMLSSWSYTLMALNKRTADEARFWLAGSLAGRPLDVVYVITPFLAVGVVLALALIRPLNALALGDEAAVSLGVRPARARVLGGAAVVLLAGGAVAGAGPIAFVGLAVPHLVRLVTGPDHRWLVPGCLLAGPVLLLAADMAGRVVMAPLELEVGIVTAFLGAPALFLLARYAKVVSR
ncbi:iron ABC transporter permease [Carbonactinospora thermoautotrophica]|uniref:ABC-type transporter n=1 Tax=Carbonactinospora thermoautotrophica TaxID=1469144 RepID=A0A132MVC4_9ACTN|nr:iron ABC transporter permease [Carbonactinospora thermoautotrophica]KWX00161.1 hypothetical protein TH66_14710 [Carbonactinospora thermoautotrophica]KWX01858.1 ABC-type transporter [Carbonactinospora thermoautotrophica]MCX9190992.1 iron ABC transporter permease [Carbonactinospora thermoautotrophica]